MSVEMDIQKMYDRGREKLARSGVREADLDAWYLLEHVTGVDRAGFYLHPERKLTKEEALRYEELTEKRSRRIPLQHLTGEQEFMGLTFQVNEHVLIPRQDTEILVETGLSFLNEGKVPSDKKSGKRRILDMCTGSGCILLSLLSLAKDRENMEGIGADISGEAIEVAKKNAEALSVEAVFSQGDLFEAVSGRFGMILSNPPYIRTEELKTLEPEVKDHDPVLALDGKEDGLFFYRKIVGLAGNYLEKGGLLLFEIGCDQGEDVSVLMKENGYRDVTVKKDLAGLDRVVLGVYDR